MCFRDDALAGRHIVISGGCGAIGIGVVKKLTDHGATLTVNDLLDPAAAEARLKEAEIPADRTAYVQADLTQAEDVSRFHNRRVQRAEGQQRGLEHSML